MLNLIRTPVLRTHHDHRPGSPFSLQDTPPVVQAHNETPTCSHCCPLPHYNSHVRCMSAKTGDYGRLALILRIIHVPFSPISEFEYGLCLLGGEVLSPSMAFCLLLFVIHFSSRLFACKSRYRRDPVHCLSLSRILAPLATTPFHPFLRNISTILTYSLLSLYRFHPRRILLLSITHYPLARSTHSLSSQYIFYYHSYIVVLQVTQHTMSRNDFSPSLPSPFVFHS